VQQKDLRSGTIYRIFSNLIRTLFTVLEGQKVGCVLDSWSRVGFWKNDTAAVHAVRTIQYTNLLFYLLLIIHQIHRHHSQDVAKHFEAIVCWLCLHQFQAVYGHAL
jgi:hypothetical protein